MEDKEKEEKNQEKEVYITMAFHSGCGLCDRAGRHDNNITLHISDKK